MEDNSKKISEVCNSIEIVLLEKNKRYGDAALNPLSIFTNHLGENRATDLILTRLDDKLSRVKNSKELRKNDLFDMIGYLILLCVKKSWTSFKDLLD